MWLKTAYIEIVLCQIVVDIVDAKFRSLCISAAAAQISQVRLFFPLAMLTARGKRRGRDEERVLCAGLGEA